MGSWPRFWQDKHLEMHIREGPEARRGDVTFKEVLDVV
jgi:hypothetical protein